MLVHHHIYIVGMSFIPTDYMFSKEEAFKAIMICFSDTKKTYLSYGDFHFLLHRKGKIGITAPKEKKESYKKWEKDFHFRSSTIDWPWRKFLFESSRFKEITTALMEEGKLNKTLVKNKPCYFLPEKSETACISQIRQQKTIENCSVFNSHLSTNLESTTWYYGCPIRYPPNYLNLKTHTFETELNKLANKFRRSSIEFMSIMQDLTSFMIKDLISEIEKGLFTVKDKKLAFLYLDQFFSIDGKNDFVWEGDGEILEYLPTHYIVNSKVSELLYHIAKFDRFWASKLITIEPHPTIKQLKKSNKDIIETQKIISQYIKKY